MIERLIHAARARIDITRGPLLQVVLVHGRSHDRLVVNVHHLAADAYAIDLLLRDLEMAYTAINSGTAPSLPATITSLRAYGGALDTYLASAEFRQETDYIQALGTAGLACSPRMPASSSVSMPPVRDLSLDKSPDALPLNSRGACGRTTPRRMSWTVRERGLCCAAAPPPGERRPMFSSTPSFE